eukprot:12404335-Karenia_brevis.AAC.1
MYSHRLGLAWVNAVLKGGIVMLSIYPKDSEGLSETNLYFLEQVAVVLRTLKGPWVIAGDWNLAPLELAAS